MRSTLKIPCRSTNSSAGDDQFERALVLVLRYAHSGSLEAAGDQLNFGIYVCSSLDDLFDPGMRAADNPHNSIRCIDSKRQLIEFPGARSFRHKGEGPRL